MTTNDVSGEAIAGFSRKYLWWQPVSGQPFSEDRIVAQTMNLGTYDDILLLEQTVASGRGATAAFHPGCGEGFVVHEAAASQALDRTVDQVGRRATLLEALSNLALGAAPERQQAQTVRI